MGMFNADSPLSLSLSLTFSLPLYLSLLSISIFVSPCMCPVIGGGAFRGVFVCLRPQHQSERGAVGARGGTFCPGASVNAHVCA